MIKDGAASVALSNLKCWDTPENIRNNIVSACQRGLPELEGIEAHDGNLTVAASSPSLSDHVHKLNSPIMCVNGAQDYLIERDIIPEWCVLLDSTKDHQVTPHPDVHYLIASQCHPSIFDMLDGFKVTLWHAAVPDETVGEPFYPFIKKHAKGEWVIPGGGTAALRCFCLGKVLGFRKITAYGLDSSFRGEQHHVSPSMPIQGSYCEIEYAGKKFHTNVPLAAQADNFEKMYLVSLNDCRINVIGEGLIPHICQQLNAIKYGHSTATF